MNTTTEALATGDRGPPRRARTRRRARGRRPRDWPASRSRCTSRTSRGRATSERYEPVQYHVVLPNDIDDPSTPSGGNVYDRQICDGLAALGWSVHEHAVHGSWPQPAPTERADLGRVLSALPDDAVVLIDGLVASTVPDVLAPQRRGCGWSYWCTCRSATRPWTSESRNGSTACPWPPRS